MAFFPRGESAVTLRTSILRKCVERNDERRTSSDGDRAPLLSPWFLDERDNPTVVIRTGISPMSSFGPNDLLSSNGRLSYRDSRETCIAVAVCRSTWFAVILCDGPSWSNQGERPSP